MAEAAFVGAGAAAGLELWRIENMAPVKMETVDGKFHVGDSYILLSTKKSKTSNNLEWHLHFWLGEETTQDESGVAAYKSVELDESLGGGPIQHREVQGHESDLFMSYFKSSGVEYLPGGVASGFTHVERGVYRTRLLQCKGKRSVRVGEVECAAASLNTGDVFILDMGVQLFMYNGATASRQEKAKGFDVVHKLHNERGASGTITIIEEEPHNATFWEALGGEIEVTNTGEDDAAASAAAEAEIKLFHVDDNTGTIQVTEVPRDGQGNFTRDMLDSGDAYILDAGSQIFVWTGKGASREEKNASMATAAQYLTDYNRPSHTPIERQVETGETVLFKSYFKQFDPLMTPAMMHSRRASNVAAMPEEHAVDFRKMHANQTNAETPVDDGSGTLQVWRVEDFKKVEVHAEKYGHFYTGDSYILLYTYMQGSREAHIIYFWQGDQSSTDEKGASALLAKELDDEMGGSPVQVRVVQGKEPLHFRQLFRGRMVVHQGGKASGFKNSTEEDHYDDDGVSLFHVRGTTELNTFATQTEEVAASLNSTDCFVLVTPATVFSWNGNASNDSERAVALSIAELLQQHSYGPPGTAAPERALAAVVEGEEPEEFWAALGGQGEYPQIGPGEPVPADPRLFACSNAFGTFEVEEVVDFEQEDLNQDDVYLLDVQTSLYVWIGHGANDQEKAKAMDTAKQYNETAGDGRDADTPIIKIQSGNEPALFTQFFASWDPELTEKNKFVDPYQARLDKLKAEQDAKAAAEEAEEAKAAPAPPVGSAALATNFVEGVTHSYETLAAGLPDGVDPTKKETYLSDAEFSEKFGMDKAAFAALPAWKKTASKKKLGLF